MRKLLLSALIGAGLTLVGVNSFAVYEQPQDAQKGQQIEQEIKQEVKTKSETIWTPESESKAPAEGEEYIVKEGDTLLKIAKEFLGSEGGGTDWMKEITGEVTDVMDSTIKVKDEMGKTHTIRVADSLETGSLELEEVKVGDDVHIEFENGQAITIHKTEDMKGSRGASEEGKGG